MIKFEHTETFNWEGAARGLRNPFNSWEMSDSDWEWEYETENVESYHLVYKIGENDLALMKKLAKSGSDHRKYMRMIMVSVDITAPLYWWKEFDTYKVGTVANSCSTMHTIHKKEFTMDDFSTDHLVVNRIGDGWYHDFGIVLAEVITVLNNARERYLETGDKGYWYPMIQLLPSSYNQKRTVQLNYEVLRNMYHSRKNHKLDEWHTFCDWIESLPYSEIITGDIGHGEEEQTSEDI